IERRVRLRALIHNASIGHNDDQGADALQQMFMVHMQAPYLLNLASDQLFDPVQVGDIIHISDHVAQRGSARHIAYSASKAGLDGLVLRYCSLKGFKPTVKCTRSITLIPWAFKASILEGLLVTRRTAFTCK